MFAASVLALGPGLASAQVLVVYPTGTFPTDVENVRSALGAGGTVVLKATDVSGTPTAFDFGPPVPGGGSVVMRREVTVVGESVGEDMTTIRGGFFPLRGIGAPGRIVVRDIHFDGPGGNAFNFIFSDSAEFSSNKITGVVGDVFPDGVSEGIGVFGFRYSGEFVITDNVIDGFDADAADGIVLFEGSRARIVGNEINGSHTLGIGIISPSGPVGIEDNLVVPGPGDPSFDPGNGIFGINPHAGGTFNISGNRVDAENPNADGIAVGGFSRPVVGAVIENNQVLMHNSLFGAISLYGNVTDTYVGQNRATGSGAFALPAFTLGLLQRSNTFVGNNITGFESDIADVFLDINTEDTVLAGFGGSVIDRGTNNRITGFTKLTPDANLGQQISEAQALRRDAIEGMESPPPRRAVEG